MLNCIIGELTMKLLFKVLIGLMLITGLKSSAMEQASPKIYQIQSASFACVPDDVKRIICTKLINLADIATLRRLAQTNSKYRRLLASPPFLSFILTTLQQELQRTERPMKNQYKISLDEEVCKIINPCIFRVHAAAKFRTHAALNWLQSAMTSNPDMQSGTRLFFYTLVRRTHPLVKQVELVQEKKQKEVASINAFLHEKRMMISFMLDVGMDPNMILADYYLPIFLSTFTQEYQFIFNKYGISRPEIFQLLLSHGANINYKNVGHITLLDAFLAEGAPGLNREHYIRFLKEHGAKQESELP